MLSGKSELKKGMDMAGSIEDRLKSIDPRGRTPEPDPDAIMESLGPCAWCFPKMIPALDIEDGAKPVVTFQFVYLGMRSEFTPEQFTFLFGEKGREQWKLTVRGRNLRPVFDRINEHRVRRLRTVDRDFAADGDKQPIITKIEVVEVVEEK
jgi:hypothetical protein